MLCGVGTFIGIRRIADVNDFLFMTFVVNAVSSLNVRHNRRVVDLRSNARIAENYTDY